MKKGCLAGAVCLVLILLSGCGASDARQESTSESGSQIQEEQSPGINSETTPESGEESQPGSPSDDGRMDSPTGETLSGTETGAEYVGDAVFVIDREESGSSYIRDWYIIGDDSAAWAAEYARRAYEAFLDGSILKFDSADIRRWRLDNWWEDILLLGGEMEYAYLDLDGDGVEELLVQYKDSPEAYNGVFHYEDGKLYCWQNDGMEGNCRDYPLRDGTMVRQYDYNGSSSYTLFRYRTDGNTEKLTDLFIRYELINPDSTDPCPYYEIGRMEVDKNTFEEQLKNLVTDQRLEPSDWTALVP